MNWGKIARYGVIVFLIFMVVYRPTEAAHIGKAILAGLSHAGNSIAVFLNKVTQ